MTPLSVSCALFYIRHRYFHSGTETVQDDDPLLFSTLTVFLKLFKFSENTSLAKWNVSVLVISVHLCVSSMWIWNVGTIHLSNHSIVFLGINYITVWNVVFFVDDELFMLLCSEDTALQHSLHTIYSWLTYLVLRLMHFQTTDRTSWNDLFTLCCAKNEFCSIKVSFIVVLLFQRSLWNLKMHDASNS